MNLRTTRRRFRVPPSVHAPWLGWAWNGTLDDERLGEQIDAVVRAGFGGVAIYPHHGLQAGIHSTPGWFEHVAAVSRRIRRKTLSIHLRETLEGPFAAVDDALCHEHPEVCLTELFLEELDTPDSVVAADRFGLPNEPVAAFRVETTAPALPYRVQMLGRLAEPASVSRVTGPIAARAGRVLVFRTRTIPNRLNYLDRRAAELFLQTVPSQLAAHTKRYLGHPISGLYIDGIGLRLTPGALPWDPEIDTLFQETRGYSLLSALPSLYFNLPGYERVRYDYWTIINDMLREGLATPIKEWCQQHRLRFGVSLRPLDRRDPALLENALLPVERVSDDFALRIPYDVLDRGFENSAAFGEWLVAIKRISSNCEQHGAPRQAAISIGCETPVLDLERALALGMWLHLLGAQTVIFERLMYRPDHDKDAVGLNDQDPCWAALETINTTLGRIGGMMRQGYRHADVALLYPASSLQAVYAHPLRAAQNAPAASPARMLLDHLTHLSLALHEAGVDFEFVQEKTLVEVGIADRRTLAVGHERYRVLIVPPSVNLRGETVAVLEDYLSGGGTLLFAGSVPYLVDGDRSDAVERLVAEYELHAPTRSDLFDYQPVVEFLRKRRIAPVPEESVPPPAMVCRRTEEDAEVYFAFNPSPRARDLSLSLPTAFDGHLERWDPRTGDMHGVSACTAAEPLRISDRWNGYEARVYVAMSTVFRESPSDASHTRLPGPVPLWTVARSEPNVLGFEPCRLDEEFDSDATRTVEEARDLLRDAIAGSGMPVSWRSRWEFYSIVGKEDLAVTLLIPGDELSPDPEQRVLLDGEPLRNPHRRSYCGSVYHSYTSPKLEPGAHTIEWFASYRTAEEFFSPLVLGEFAMTAIGSEIDCIGHAPRQIDFGRWREHGLTYYPGPVVYRGTWTVLDFTRNERVVLAVDSGAGAATVRVNGNEAGALLWKPYEIDVTRFMKRGENIVEIVLSAFPGQRDGRIGLGSPPRIHIESPGAGVSD